MNGGCFLVDADLDFAAIRCLSFRRFVIFNHIAAIKDTVDMRNNGGYEDLLFYFRTPRINHQDELVCT